MFRIDRSRVNIADVRELQVTLIDSGASVTELLDEHVSLREPKPDPYEAARAKADELLESAGREADAIDLRAKDLLRKAKAEAEQMKAEAKQLGYDQGYAEGRAEGEQQFDALIAGHSDAFSNVLAELKRAGDTMISDMEGDIIDLCFSVLRKITAFDRTADGEIFKAVIKKAVSQVDLSGKVSIRLSHEDCERFFPDGEAVFEINDTAVTVAVTSDPEFEGGDIAVDTDSETVIAGPKTQLRNIEILFRHRIGKDNG